MNLSLNQQRQYEDELFSSRKINVNRLFKREFGENVWPGGGKRTHLVIVVTKKGIWEVVFYLDYVCMKFSRFRKLAAYLIKKSPRFLDCNPYNQELRSSGL